MIRKFIVFLVALFVWSLPLAALAGKVEFRDEAALLSTPMRDSIVTRARRWSFSTRVLVSSSSATRSAFERRAIDALNAADMLVIGIDPVHRYTVVRMGMGLSLEANAYSSIASAGNSSFKDRLWADGIGAIGDKAQSSIAVADYIRNTKNMEVPARPPVRGLGTQSQDQVRPGQRASDATSSIGWLLLGLIVTLIVICTVWAIIARRREAATERRARQALIDAEADRILNADRRRESASMERDAAPVAPMPSRYQSAPREPSYAPPPRMVAPAVVRAPAAAPIVQHVYHQPAPPPAPVVIHQDRNDGLLTGMLLNEAMHSHHHHDRSDRHVVVERERVVEVEREPASSSYDGGGASSSWGTPAPAEETSYSSSSPSSFESSSSYDGGGSSSSWDSGSSGSSFDSSSSSSSFDSGGGSSDF